MASPRVRWPRQHIVVTSGPTREYLDDIRFLTNASTGRMGIELARAFRARGARVTLVQGPTTLQPPRGVEVVRVVSTRDLLKATRAACKDATAVVFAAAPSDYRPKQKRRGKPAREAGALTLAMEPTEDVAATLGKRKGTRVHVGFALEVAKGNQRALGKIAKKRFDAIVLNGPQNFGAGGGAARWLTPDGTSEDLPNPSKAALARAIVTRVGRLLRLR